VSSAITRFRGEHAWLSNFFRVDIVLDGATYRLGGARVSGGEDAQSGRAGGRVAAVASPAIAKRLGNQPGRNAMRLEVMRELLRKFGPGTVLAEKLLATEGAHLQEANRWGRSLLGDGVRPGGESPRKDADAHPGRAPGESGCLRIKRKPLNPHNTR
jgi:predicted NAD-dependent protein-ADP-ribosyltransferase YbiA (DUF1768 family)